MDMKEDKDLVWFDRSSPPGTQGEEEEGRGDGDESGSPQRTPGREKKPLHTACVMPVGSPRSGKTSLIEAILYNRFRSEYRETSLAQYGLECDYVDPVESSIAAASEASAARRKKRGSVKMKRVQISKVGLSLVDISGADDHAAERQIHYKNADVVMFVYDITNRNSLVRLRDVYYPEACRMKDEDPLQMPHILVGTKKDLFEKVGREGDHVTELEANEVASQLGADGCWSIRTSAKELENIEDLKTYLLSIVVANTPREDDALPAASPPPSPKWNQWRRKMWQRKQGRCVLQ